MKRPGFAVAVATAGLGLYAGAAHAAVPRAEVRGVDDRALRAMIIQAIGDAPARSTSRVEARRRAEDAAQKAIAVLRSQGYYDYAVQPDIGEGDAPVSFVTVTPGPLTKIADAAIEWTDAPPDAKAQAAAQAAMALKPGDAGQAEAVIAAEGRIVAALQKQGYADAAAGAREVVVDHADRSMRPTFRIAAGDLVRMGAVRIEGKSRTRARWLLRQAPWKPGQVYRPRTVAEFERRLTETGVYNSVTVALASPSETVNGQRPVIVSLADRPKGALELGASYSTTEGAGVNSSWILYNRLGLADTLTNTVLVAQIDSRIQSQFALPNWRRPNETLKLTGAIYRDRTPAYNDDGVGIGADLMIRYSRTSFLDLGVSVDGTRTSQNEALNYILGKKERDLVTTALITAFTLDRSNDLLNPIRGWKLEARAEPTAAEGDGSILYVKLTSQAVAYLPLDADGDTVIAGRAKLGVIAGGNIPGVPAQNRFFGGGGGSVRGYGYQDVGPRYPDNTPEGGLSLFESSVELRRRLFGAWGAAAFVDAGSVGDQAYPDFREPQIGVGIGVRYNLGFGPIRVDVATPINPRHGDAPIQAYLSIGQSF